MSKLTCSSLEVFSLVRYYNRRVQRSLIMIPNYIAAVTNVVSIVKMAVVSPDLYAMAGD